MYILHNTLFATPDLPPTAVTKKFLTPTLVKVKVGSLTRFGRWRNPPLPLLSMIFQSSNNKEFMVYKFWCHHELFCLPLSLRTYCWCFLLGKVYMSQPDGEVVKASSARVLVVINPDWHFKILVQVNKNQNSDLEILVPVNKNWIWNEFQRFQEPEAMII